MRLIRLIAITVALVVGFTAGFYAVRKMTKREDTELRLLRESVERSAPLQHQYRGGDYARAREALAALARLYDEFDAQSGSRVNPYAFDAGMCYARLAVLEERHGNDGAAAMGEAVRRCERLKSLSGRRRDCSEDYLRREVARLDALPVYEAKDGD